MLFSSRVYGGQTAESKVHLPIRSSSLKVTLIHGHVCMENNKKTNTYLLLTELEGRTESYGPSFFSPIDLWPKREARGP